MNHLYKSNYSSLTDVDVQMDVRDSTNWDVMFEMNMSSWHDNNTYHVMEQFILTEAQARSLKEALETYLEAKYDEREAVALAQFDAVRDDLFEVEAE